MQYQLLAAAALASTVAAYSNTTETVTDLSTTLVTITHCEENKCSATVSPALQSVATVTVEGVETVYTTYCPLTAEEKSTLSTVTTTIAGVETIYTTYCPLTEEESTAVASTPVAPITSTAQAVVTPVSTASEELESTVFIQSTLYTSLANKTAPVTQFEGAAAKQAAVGFAAVAGLVAALL
ncbi:putative GPI-anchored protein 6 [Spathaspora sp. JA1]|nr:putative GPI-anchored protein 6 [Spathaspora sp. JA1]